MVFYLVQMIACSGILYAYYHFFLRNEKFHQYNRFYLLGSIILSVALPIFKIPIEINNDEQANAVYTFVSTGKNIVVTAKKHFDYFNIIYIVYGIIAIFLLIKLAFAVKKIIRIKNEAAVQPLHDIKFITTQHPDAPFSFFKWLFWNDQTELQSPAGQQIFNHELYHIRSKHSWDNIFIEVLLCILWFNPFFYLYRKELKTIQEFLADKHTSNRFTANEYAELLLLQAMGSRQQYLINPFFHNQIKRRIAMLLSSKKPKHQWLRKLLVLPIATIIISLFAFSYKQSIASKSSEAMGSNTPYTKQSFIEYNSTDAKGYDTIPEKNNMPALPEVYVKVDVDASFPGGASAWREYLMKNLDAGVPVKNGAKAGTYKVIVQFIVDKNGTVSDVKAITNHGFGMETESVRVIKNSGKWQPAIYKGNKVKAYRRQPITFAISDENKNNAKPVSNYTNNSEPEIFTRAEKDAAYPGGSDSWVRFLERNLDASVAVKNGAKPGTYTTITQFIVDKDGNISDIKSLSKVGYGMEEEALRVIKKSGKWQPAVQNGRIVKAYRKQPITFAISDENKNNAKPVSNYTNNSEPEIFTRAEKDAAYPGGSDSWVRFLERNLDASVAVKNGAKPGTYTTITQFIVDKDGNISDIKSLSKVGYGMEEEALRVIKKSGKWQPAVQNGRIVKAYRKQPISFQIIEEKAKKN